MENAFTCSAPLITKAKFLNAPEIFQLSRTDIQPPQS
jgi:hypothetical protein